MSEQWEQEAAQHFTRPWSERRGIESIDRNARTVLVKAPLEVLSDILAETAIETHRDVLGGEIVILDKFAFVYQLNGHDWSIVASDSALSTNRELAELSRRLQQPVIELRVSDTCGFISYSLFEAGEFVEYFAGDEGGNLDAEAQDPKTQRFVVHPSPYEPEYFLEVYFWSNRRQIVAEEISSISSLAIQLLVDYDAFDPAIDAGDFIEGYFPKLGQRYRIQTPKFTLGGLRREVVSVPDLVRVDYFRFDTSLKG